MRISDWSSDVCSSDLVERARRLIVCAAIAGLGNAAAQIRCKVARVRQFAHIFEHTAHRARAVESSLGTAKHFDASKVVDIAIGRVPTASGEGRGVKGRAS